MLKKILASLVLLVAVLISGLYTYKANYLAAPVPDVLEVTEETVIVIDGAIFDKGLSSVYGGEKRAAQMYGERKIVHMPDKTNQLIDLVRNGEKHITIQLNSGGGLMSVGMAFLAAMRGAQQQGVHVTCVVDRKAMSMALIIFSSCDTRYATFGSLVMWHSIAMQGLFRLNEQKTLELLDFMRAKNEEVWASTRIHFFPGYFVEHFVNETILDASEVEREGIGYLRVINQLKIIPKDKPEETKEKEEKIQILVPVIPDSDIEP